MSRANVRHIDTGTRYSSPVPKPLRLVGTAQIRDILGVTRSRCAQIVNTKGFPDPVGKLGAAQIWLAEDVEKWAEERAKRLGR